jgi:hypothetical protein
VRTLVVIEGMHEKRVPRVRLPRRHVLIPSDVINLDDDTATLAMARGFVMPMLGWG